MLSAVTWCFPWPQPSIGHTAQGSGYVQWWPWVDVVTCWAAAALCTHQDKQLTTTCWMDCFCFHSFVLCNIFVIEGMFHFHCDLKHSCAHVFIHLLLDQVSGVPASVDFRVHGHSKYFTTFYSDQNDGNNNIVFTKERSSFHTLYLSVSGWLPL